VAWNSPGLSVFTFGAQPSPVTKGERGVSAQGWKSGGICAEA
jgi:hypothetical protein